MQVRILPRSHYNQHAMHDMPAPGSDRLRMEHASIGLQVYREELSGLYLCRLETRRGVAWGIGHGKEEAVRRALELLARPPR
jgi:hypothetical protein